VFDVQSTTDATARHGSRDPAVRPKPCEVGVDIFNALNGSTPLSLNNAFGAWQQPNEILLARFVKLNVQFDF
jgi:hypothetical protein